MYHFIDLDDAQKQQRRDLLDWYAFVAQTSALAPLACVLCASTASSLRRRWAQYDSVPKPSSPQVKEERMNHIRSGRAWKIQSRKLRWWLGDDLNVLGVYIGTKGQALLTVFWTSWLLYLSFVQTGDGTLLCLDLDNL
jgi:hypothetical protein